MDATPSQPPLAVKKGLANVKGFSAIASQSLQAVAFQIQVPPSAPLQATSISPSAPPMAVPPTIAPAPSKLQSPLQVLEQEEYGTDTSTSSFIRFRTRPPSAPGKNRQSTIYKIAR